MISMRATLYISTAPEVAKNGTAPLVMDMISSWDFEDVELIQPDALETAPFIVALTKRLKRCYKAGPPVILCKRQPWQVASALI